MARISHEELLKLARMSNVALHPDEVDTMTKQIESVLSYAERVTEVSEQVEQVSYSNRNVMRPDVVAPCIPQEILDRAPEREGDFFVVPAIIERSA